MDDLDVFKASVAQNRDIIVKHGEDLEEIKRSIQELKITQALINQKLDNVNDTVSKFSGGINRGLWLIGGGFITVFFTWVSSGLFGR